VDSSVFKRNLFQYYEPGFLSRKDGKWFFKGERLNVVASIDFAFTINRRSDYTAIVVLGVDGRHNYYVLEIDRFRTEKISEYFEHILKMFQKWGFRKIRTEITAAQKTIVTDLQNSYIRPLGLSLAVEEFRPTKWMGAKEERIMAALEPKYANKQIWHYPGGNCQVLEEELIFSNPAHDDVKDALASAVDFASSLAPLNIFSQQKVSTSGFNFNAKFGGVV
jgi:phage terminase large subunit-like protein